MKIALLFREGSLTTGWVCFVKSLQERSVWKKEMAPFTWFACTLNN